MDGRVRKGQYGSSIPRRALLKAAAGAAGLTLAAPVRTIVRIGPPPVILPPLGSRARPRLNSP